MTRGRGRQFACPSLATAVPSRRRGRLNSSWKWSSTPQIASFPARSILRPRQQAGGMLHYTDRVIDLSANPISGPRPQCKVDQVDRRPLQSRHLA